MKVGIDSVRVYTPNAYYPLAELAERNGVDPDKYVVGIGQEEMSVPSPDEDIVTMAANAAQCVLDEQTRASLSTVILATESGIDQSKSAGLFVHSLLGLRENCRVFEMKQACYGATAGIQLACSHVRQRPHEKVLIIASDIARYDQHSAGEPTQGAGAVAMVISANPRILEIHPAQGKHSADVMDFWRPNYRKTALVDGSLSIDAYMKSLERAWRDYREDGGLPLNELRWLCFHQPFTKMAKKAFKTICAIEPEQSRDLTEASFEYSQIYGRRIGNCYTASLYIALTSLLENCPEDLTGHHVGLFSYGSGSVGEFFSGTIVPGYQAQLRTRWHNAMLNQRERLDYQRYEDWFYRHDEQVDPVDYTFPVYNKGRFRLSHMHNHQRVYMDTHSEMSKAS